MPGAAAEPIAAVVEGQPGDEDPVDRLGRRPRAAPAPARGCPASPGVRSLARSSTAKSRSRRSRPVDPRAGSRASPRRRPSPGIGAGADLLGEGRDVEQDRPGLGPAGSSANAATSAASCARRSSGSRRAIAARIDRRHRA